MKTIKCLPCTEPRYGEFPEMLFGLTDDNMTYFDATMFIIKYGDIKKHTIREFDIVFYFCKKAVSSSYEIDLDDLITKDEATGHILIHESLDLVFISYVDPTFGVYMLEKVSELFINGLSFSDNYLISTTLGRFSKEDLIKILENEEKPV